MAKANNKHKRVRVTGAEEERSPEALRRLGRAVIALARAQLEAEAEAAHRRKAKPERTKASSGGPEQAA